MPLLLMVLHQEFQEFPEPHTSEYCCYYLCGHIITIDGSAAYAAGKAAGPTVNSTVISAFVSGKAFSASFSLKSIPNYASRTLWKDLFPSLSGLNQWAYDTDETSGSIGISYTASTGTLTISTGVRVSSWGGTTQKITVYYI